MSALGWASEHPKTETNKQHETPYMEEHYILSYTQGIQKLKSMDSMNGII